MGVSGEAPATVTAAEDCSAAWAPRRVTSSTATVVASIPRTVSGCQPQIDEPATMSRVLRATTLQRPLGRAVAFSKKRERRLGDLGDVSYLWCVGTVRIGAHGGNEFSRITVLARHDTLDTL